MLKQVKRVSTPEKTWYMQHNFNGVEHTMRIMKYRTEKFFKKGKSTVKESEWEVNDLNYPELKGQIRYRFRKYKRFYTNRTIDPFSSYKKKFEKEQRKNANKQKRSNWSKNQWS